MLIVTALPMTPVLTLTELDLGIVVKVNELPSIFSSPGDHPPLPEKLADKLNVLVPSALWPTVTVRSISMIT